MVKMKHTTETVEQPREEEPDSGKSAVFTSSDHSTRIVYKPSLFYNTSKFICDIVCASIGIVVLFPVFLIIALCIKLDDGGSIFYRREMIGFRGKRFFMLKFRTMIPNAESYLAKNSKLMREYQQNMKLRHDPRITKIGRFLRKTYLDELPQLFNVLAGQMSLVGPRAIHKSELTLYGEYAQKRHAVKPGITGLWQVNPQRHSTYEERIPLDMQYIDNRSLILDLKILGKTVKAIIAHSGV
jgi:exopolysaccharide production protein ExoY